jgi:hypothetical protein
MKAPPQFIVIWFLEKNNTIFPNIVLFLII